MLFTAPPDVFLITKSHHVENVCNYASTFYTWRSKSERTKPILSILIEKTLCLKIFYSLWEFEFLLRFSQFILKIFTIFVVIYISYLSRNSHNQRNNAQLYKKQVTNYCLKISFFFANYFERKLFYFCNVNFL